MILDKEQKRVLKGLWPGILVYILGYPVISWILGKLDSWKDFIIYIAGAVVVSIVIILLYLLGSKIPKKTNTDEKEAKKASDNSKNKTSVAHRDDWKTQPMPEHHETFVLNRSFSEEEMNVLRCGNIPKAMEDKWFWYMEGETLWAHRSWTGFCIYQIDFKNDNHHLVTVNRDPEQYGCTNIEEDIESLNDLLDWWVQTPYDHRSEWLSETFR